MNVLLINKIEIKIKNSHLKMEKLNSDAKMQILMKLSGDEIVKVCQTSKDLYRACNDERYTPLWGQKIKDEFNIDYNGERGYDKYRDLRTIFGTRYYIVKMIDTDDAEESFSTIFLTKEQAEMFIVIQLADRFTYAQIKSSLRASDGVRDSFRLYNIEEYKMQPISSTDFEDFEEEKRKYEEDYENIKGDKGKDFDQLVNDVVNGLNSEIASGISKKKLENKIDESVQQFVELFGLDEKEVKNFIKKSILVERR